MGYVSDFIDWVKESVPNIAAKICTFLLLIFALGMFFGWFIAMKGQPIWLLVPIVSMFVMYYKLDEGFLLFIVLMILAIFLA